MRNRVTPTQSGTYQLWLRPNETVLVRDLVAQLRDQLTASTDAPVVRRLFPPAYANDADRDAGYQVLTRDELLDAKLQALAAVDATLPDTATDEDTVLELGETELTAWMHALNNLRLVLGTRLDVEEELPDLDPDDPQAPAFAVYEFLGWLLAQIVDTISGEQEPQG